MNYFEKEKIWNVSAVTSRLDARVKIVLFCWNTRPRPNDCQSYTCNL